MTKLDQEIEAIVVNALGENATYGQVILLRNSLTTVVKTAILKAAAEGLRLSRDKKVEQTTVVISSLVLEKLRITGLQ
jgi:hypothetical protein